MRTLEEVFDDLGGPSKIGQVLGISTEHAATMKRRGSIPARYWHELIKAAKRRGIDISPEELTRIHARKRAA